MFFLIIFFSFISAFCTGFLGFLIGRAGSFILSSFFIGILVILSFFCFYDVVLCGNISYFKFGTWFDSSILNCSWAFLFDQLSCFMVLIVVFISFCVHIYSCGYMFFDPHSQRFMSYLSLFTFFMLILVLADNFIVFFLGWEGVGLCSFLLISFWTTRTQAIKAALKALIINRIGDFFLFFSLLLLFYIIGSLDFTIIFFLIPFYSEITITFFNFNFFLLDIISFFLFIAVAGKSAQIGLHTWLPDAMEGPTPVSALIHAATMVTAGIFLIVRCSILFEFSLIILNFMVF